MKRSLFPTIFDEIDTLWAPLPDKHCSEGRCGKSSDGLFISENPDQFFIDASLPGVNPQDVEVTLNPQERSLTIRGEGKMERENVDWRLKGNSEFHYTIPLSKEIDCTGDVNAISRNGMLCITLKKNKENKPVKIDVRVD